MRCLCTTINKTTKINKTKYFNLLTDTDHSKQCNDLNSKEIRLVSKTKKKYYQNKLLFDEISHYNKVGELIGLQQHLLRAGFDKHVKRAKTTKQWLPIYIIFK